MKQDFETHFFLGANSPTGFYSLYGGFVDPAVDRLRIIKSGPGSGKSTFMRTIASAARKKGYSAELIQCSGDPDSLDGVWFPDLRTAYVDGTSPHVIEPVYAGSGDTYVDLSRFYDLDGVREAHGDIMRLTKAYKSYYARAYKLIESAEKAAEATAIDLPEEMIVSAVRRARGIILREIRSSGKHGRTWKRFLSAISCKGALCLFETVPALADRVYVLDNELGLAPVVIDLVAEAAEDAGWDTIRCLSPMAPTVTEHLIIPELSLAFVSQTAKMPYTDKAFRHLRLDTVPDRALSASLRAARKASSRLTDTLLDEAVSALGEAKRLHDRLEEVYHPYVDFEGVHALALAHIEELFG